MIRKATTKDVNRLSEILVFTNRTKYYPIFKDDEYSFKIYTVENVSKDLLDEKEFKLEDTLVFEEDGIIKGFIGVKEKRVVKLYVDLFFTNRMIGSQLLDKAIEEYDVNFLTVLEKNKDAKRFYTKHGFRPNGIKYYEEGTSEYLEEYIRWKIEMY